MPDKKTAFTLAEVLISVSIIGILAIMMLSATQFANKDEKVLIGKKQQAESVVVSVSKALASADNTGLALTNLTKDNNSLKDGFAPRLHTKNAQAMVSDFANYNLPENLAVPKSLPAVELTNGTTLAFEVLNPTCAKVADGGAPCGLVYVDVNEKAAGDETPQFLMAVYRDRAVSEFDLCEGYEDGKTTNIDCPANLPNGNKKKIETCNLGIITTEETGICCPSDQVPNGEVCVCKDADMELVGGTCVCKDNKVNINGVCVCEGKTESCDGNMIGSISYDGICTASGKSYTLKENTCACPSNLPNLMSDGKTCVAACLGGQVFENDVCKCPDNLPESVNGVCTCSNIVETCTSPQVGNITYAATCSASGKVKGEKITESCTCPAKDKIAFGDKEIYSPLSESCKSSCPGLQMANEAHTACVCPTPLVEKDGSCVCPDSAPTGYLASNEAWDTSNDKTCKRLKNVYIVTSYNNSTILKNNGIALTLEDTINDFSSITTCLRGTNQWGYSGSCLHNADKNNDNTWQNLLSKLSSDIKAKTFTNGEAYIITEDGKLLGAVRSDLIEKIDWDSFKNDNTTIYGPNAYAIKWGYNASTLKDEGNFEVIESLGINPKGRVNGEEGTGGQIKYNGLIYDVVYTIYRKDTPLILDLKGNGFKFTDIANGVSFDLNADGQPENTGWTAVQSEFDDAFLVYDKNNNGQVDNGKELFGNQSGSVTGFDELAKYDDNKDGVINKIDNIFGKLQLWCDMNKNGEVNDGELKTLDDAKVTEISLSFDKQYDANGNLIEDEHGNTTGMIGSFKIMTEQIVDGVVKMVETVRTMIDVLFNTVQSFFG